MTIVTHVNFVKKNECAQDQGNANINSKEPGSVTQLTTIHDTTKGKTQLSSSCGFFMELVAFDPEDKAKSHEYSSCQSAPLSTALDQLPSQHAAAYRNRKLEDET